MRINNKAARAIVKDWLRKGYMPTPDDGLEHLAYVNGVRRIVGAPDGEPFKFDDRQSACLWLRGLAKDIRDGKHDDSPEPI
jgi:hypothetical protein